MATDMNTSQVVPSGHPIFIPETSIAAARDSRYRHPANAIAELVDNAIDANAPIVELMVWEREVQLASRKSYRIQELAIIDNGTGMNAETLAEALRFGGRVAGPGVRKIGKYGFGLPTSSVSQCKRVDVWSWQQDIAAAQHAYLDTDEIQAGTQREITPRPQPPPPEWLSRAKNTSATGTLVVWSKIDRINMRPDTIFRHLEEEIGRIYRHYINRGELRIRMAAFRDGNGEPRADTEVRPNDPLYMMVPSNTPGIWGQEPMFTLRLEETKQFTVNGKTETVVIRYSIAKLDALGAAGSLPGNTEYGRHARRNMGVSMVREDREVVIDDSILNRETGGGGLPQNRWWGCEVKFNAGCDDLFGIDHNKQMTSHLSGALKELSRSDLSDTQLRDEIDANESDIYEVAEHIRRTVRNMMREIQRRFGQRPPPGNGSQDQTNAVTPAQKAEALVTQVTEETLAIQETEKTQTDITFDNTAAEEKIIGLAKELTSSGYPDERAQAEAEATVKSGYRYKFANADLPGFTVFAVRSAVGVLVVQLNINHPIYQYLETLERKADANADTDGTEEQAAMGLRIMILGLARMEDEFQDLEERRKFQDICYRWGRIMHKLIDEGIINVAE